MGSSTHLCLCMFVVGVGFIFLDSLSAEGDQFPDDTSIAEQGSSFFFYQNPEYPRDCSEVRDSCSSSISSGVYLIKPDGYEEPFEVYCDNDVESGGWTAILRRFDGSVDFKRNWSDYKRGFGFLGAEFWLGNDKLSFLTNQALFELRIDITLANGTSCDIKYNAFRISDEWSGYTISTIGTSGSDEACEWTAQRDCNDVFNEGHRRDGVYFIHPSGWSGPPFQVFCNMSIDGGGWTVLQRRVNGSTDFNRNWTDYRDGFGDIQHEFWLGNEKIHHLTNQATYEYRVDLVHSSTSYYNKYSSFRIDNETNKYKVTDVGRYSGSRGQSLYILRNLAFSTYDQDNDGHSFNCAEGHRSGWWHGAYFHTYSNSHCWYFQSGSSHVTCSHANLNGEYNGGNGMKIFDVNIDCSGKYTEMKIRRIS